MKTQDRSARHAAIGERVRTIRLERKMRQVDLAANAGLSWRHMIRIERGEGGEPKPETLDRLAEALGVSRSAIDGEDEDDEAHPAMTIDEVLRWHAREALRELLREEAAQ